MIVSAGSVSDWNPRPHNDDTAVVEPGSPKFRAVGRGSPRGGSTFLVVARFKRRVARTSGYHQSCWGPRSARHAVRHRRVAAKRRYLCGETPQPVIAPSDAEPTSLAYLASTPVRSGSQPSRRRASSSSSTSQVQGAGCRRRAGSGRRPHERDRAAVDRLRGDVPDAQAGGAAGEPAVGEQQHVLAQPGALDRAGDGEHLPHARARPWGPRSGSRRHRRPRCVPSATASIAPCSPSNTRAGPSNTSASKPGALHHRPLGRERAAQDGDPAGGVDRVGHARRISPSGSGGSMLGEVLGHRLAGHGQRVAVQQAGVQQRLHHHRHAADAVDVGHHVAAERLDVGQVRHPVADPVEVVEVEVDSASWAIASRCSTALVEPPSAMTTAIAFSNASLVMMSPRGDPRLDQLDDGLARPRARTRRGGGPAPAGRRSRAATCPAPRPPTAIVLAVYMPPQAPSPGQIARSIASSSSAVIMPGAGTRRRASNASMIVTVSVVRQLRPGSDRAGVEEDGGEVEPGGGHQHAGQGLVAAGEQHRAVEPLGLQDRLDRVGDDLAGRPASSASRRGPSRCRRRPRSCRTPAGTRPPRARPPWPPWPAGRRDRLHGVISFQTDAMPICGLRPVVVAHADRAQHAARGGALDPVGDVAAARFRMWLHRRSGRGGHGSRA